METGKKEVILCKKFDKNGKWDGYGKLYDSFFKNKLLYKGNFKNGKKHGEGIE